MMVPLLAGLGSRLRVEEHWVAYNAAVLFGFAFLYWFLGFTDEHFYMLGSAEVKHESSLWHSLYYAVLVHTTLGFGEFTPRTEGARLLTVLHAWAVWLPVLVGFGAASS